MPYKDKEKQKQYRRRWIAKRRKNYFIGKECKKCGSNKKLELDHIDSSTKISHRIWSWSEKRREQELAKCQILCSKCHLEKTKKQLITRIIHGMREGYEKGCRCYYCHEALLLHWKVVRLKKKSIPS